MKEENLKIENLTFLPPDENNEIEIFLDIDEHCGWINIIVLRKWIEQFD